MKEKRAYRFALVNFVPINKAGMIVNSDLVGLFKKRKKSIGKNY